MSRAEEQIQNLVKKVEDDSDILAVLLYGSYVRDEPYRDIDVCLVIDPSREKTVPFAKKGLEYIRKFDLDIHTFQELPMYIQMRILKRGKIILVKDEEKLYELAVRLIRDFEYFKPRYREYLESILHG